VFDRHIVNHFVSMHSPSGEHFVMYVVICIFATPTQSATVDVYFYFAIEAYEQVAAQVYY
jgi:hypothetical protein